MVWPYSPLSNLDSKSNGMTTFLGGSEAGGWATAAAAKRVVKAAASAIKRGVGIAPRDLFSGVGMMCGGHATRTWGTFLAQRIFAHFFSAWGWFGAGAAIAGFSAAAGAVVSRSKYCLFSSSQPGGDGSCMLPRISFWMSVGRLAVWSWRTVNSPFR